MALLFLGNSIFEGTNNGMERSFVGSFTGDAAISSVADVNFSLFGNEIPIVSNYESIPKLYSHNSLIDLIESESTVQAYTSIVSVPAKMQIGNFKQTVPLFGVDPDSYFDVCSDIIITRGETDSLSDNGVFLNSTIVDKIEKKLKRSLRIGESVSFTIASGNSFRIRKAPFLGEHDYAGSTAALERVVLVDLNTARYLADYTLGSLAVADEEEVSDDLFDFDDLFSESSDIVTNTTDDFDFDSFESDLSDTTARDSLIETDSGSWSFILLKAVEGERNKLYRNIERQLQKNDLGAEILTWRRAAGTTALIIFAVQTLFYVGLGFLGLGAVLVIMNALVFSVLERTGEIGTMRSMGASPGFIRLLFMFESMIITMGGAVLGIGLGALASYIIGISQIKIDNTLIESLFGGSSINPLISSGGILLHLAIAGVLGSLAWIYPVSLAMRIQPVSAMNKG